MVSSDNLSGLAANDRTFDILSGKCQQFSPIGTALILAGRASFIGGIQFEQPHYNANFTITPVFTVVLQTVALGFFPSEKARKREQHTLKTHTFKTYILSCLID